MQKQEIRVPNPSRRGAEMPMLHRMPSVLRIVAAIGALFACVLVVPAIATAHEGETFGSAAYGELAKTDEGAQLVLEAWQLNRELEAAKDDAPLAVKGECRSTIDVDGMGDSCVNADGDWVTSVPGRDIVSHGPDPLAAGAAIDVAAGLSGAAQAAVDGAGPANIACATNAMQPQFRAVYARPANVAYNPAKIGELRSAIYQASAYLQQQATQDGSPTSRRLRMSCSGGIPVVDAVVLPTSAAASSFMTVVTDMVAQGYGTNSSVNTMIYLDAAVEGLGGQGARPNDSQPGLANAANNGRLFSVNYNDPGAISNPNWFTLLHEAMHNMGAVQTDAPDSTGAGHCYTDMDLMCYADGGPAGQGTVLVCPNHEVDCGNDSYFNAGSPTPGSYLATHWNTGSPNNLFLDHGALTIDGTKPATPAAPTRSAFTTTTVTAAWTEPADDVGVTGYRLDRYLSGTWQTGSTIATTSSTITGLAPNASVMVRVLARDAAGNWSTASPSATISSGPDVLAPAQPAAPTLDSATTTSVTVSWAATTDDIGVASYAVWREAPGQPGTWTQVGTRTPTLRSWTVSGLTPLSTVRLRVDARDAAGNISERSAIADVMSLPDTTAPSVGYISDMAITRTSVQLSWVTTTDQSGIDGYEIQVYANEEWSTVLDTTEGGADVAGLTAGTMYRFRYRVRDGVGNTSAWSTELYVMTLPPEFVPPAPQDPPPVTGPNPTPGGEGPILNGFVPALNPLPINPLPIMPTPIVATPKDTTKPGVVGRVRAKATKKSLSFTWTAAKDNTAVTKYRVYQLVKKRYVLRKTLTITGPSSKRAFSLTRLRAKTTYTIAIEAVDAAGNVGKRVIARGRTK